MQQNDYFFVLSVLNVTKMKKFTILAVFMLLATIGVFAQSKTTVIIKEDDGTTTFVERWTHDKIHSPLPSWYYAFLNMFQSPFGPSADVPLRSSQIFTSFEWGTYGTHSVYATHNSRFGISTGLGLSNSYNFFSKDKVLRIDDDRNAYFQSLYDYSSETNNGPVSFTAYRSYLRYWSLRLPVMFQLQWDNIGPEKETLVFAIGAELEWRFAARSFARYGSKHLITDDLNYNGIGCNALCSVGFDNISLFLRTGLTDMLSIKDGDNLYQFSLGIGFTFD